MAKGKEARLIVKLKSEASDHCYFTQKNKNNSKERHPAAQVRPDRPQARHVQGSQQAVSSATGGLPGMAKSYVQLGASAPCFFFTNRC